MVIAVIIVIIITSAKRLECSESKNGFENLIPNRLFPQDVQGAGVEDFDAAARGAHGREKSDAGFGDVQRETVLLRGRRFEVVDAESGEIAAEVTVHDGSVVLVRMAASEDEVSGFDCLGCAIGEDVGQEFVHGSSACGLDEVDEKSARKSDFVRESVGEHGGRDERNGESGSQEHETEKIRGDDGAGKRRFRGKDDSVSEVLGERRDEGARKADEDVFGDGDVESLEGVEHQQERRLDLAADSGLVRDDFKNAGRRGDDADGEAGEF